MRDRTDVHVVPAQPGWYVLDWDHNDDDRFRAEPKRTPVVAWMVCVKHPDQSAESMPIVANDKGAGYTETLLAPDGSVIDCDGNTYASLGFYREVIQKQLERLEQAIKETP